MKDELLELTVNVSENIPWRYIWQLFLDFFFLNHLVLVQAFFFLLQQTCLSVINLFSQKIYDYAQEIIWIFKVLFF